MGFKTLDPARGLDTFAANFICEKARGLVGKFGYSASDRKDIEQELACHLIAIFPQYDSAKSSRTTFVANVVTRKLVSMLRYRQALCRRLDSKRTSLNESVCDWKGRPCQRAQTLDATRIHFHRGESLRTDQALAELRLDINEVILRLPSQLQDLCKLLQHMPLKEVVKNLNLSRQTASRRITTILEHFQDGDLDQYL